MDWIKRYEADRMAEGKKIEARGIRERKDFLKKYPIEDIPKLTIEQYISGDDSFSYWLHYKLRNISETKWFYTSVLKYISKIHRKVYRQLQSSI